MSWYYELNEEQQGPVSAEELKSLIGEGKLPPNSRVWTQGMEDWEDFEKVFSQCPSCDLLASPGELIPVGEKTVCAGCSDGFTQRLREGVSTEMGSGSRGTGGTLTASELRAKARQTLTGNWAVGVGATLIFGAISIVSSLIPLIGTIFQYIISGPLTMGYSRLFLDIERDGNPEVGDLFKGFSKFFPCVGAYFLFLIITLFTMVLGALPGGIFLGVISFPMIQEGGTPGDNPLFAIAVLAAFLPAMIAVVYVALRYGFVYFVMADEDKDLGVFDSFKESSRLMKGRVLKAVGIWLSFIGWSLLSILTIGIGFLWLYPYAMTTYAAFYDDVHE